MRTSIPRFIEDDLTKLENKFFEMFQDTSPARRTPSSGEMDLLDRLKVHHMPKYLHSLRTGIKAIEILLPTGFDARPAGYAGVFNDIGYLNYDTSLIDSNMGYDAEDKPEMQGHSQAGYDLLTGVDRLMTASMVRIIHSFKRRNAYPNPIPALDPKFSGNREMYTYLFNARVAALADTYDTLKHETDNDGNLRFPERDDLVGELNHNFPDMIGLVDSLFKKGVFT